MMTEQAAAVGTLLAATDFDDSRWVERPPDDADARIGGGAPSVDADGGSLAAYWFGADGRCTWEMDEADGGLQQRGEGSWAVCNLVALVVELKTVLTRPDPAAGKSAYSVHAASVTGATANSCS